MPDFAANSSGSAAEKEIAKSPSSGRQCLRCASKAMLVHPPTRHPILGEVGVEIVRCTCQDCGFTCEELVEKDNDVT